MEFTVTIRMGNSEMQTGDDVGRALIPVISALRYMDEPWTQGNRITDANGQPVGEWGFRES